MGVYERWAFEAREHKQIRVPKIKSIKQEYNPSECVFNGKTFQNPRSSM